MPTNFIEFQLTRRYPPPPRLLGLDPAWCPEDVLTDYLEALAEDGVYFIPESGNPSTYFIHYKPTTPLSKDAERVVRVRIVRTGQADVITEVDMPPVIVDEERAS